MRYYEGSESNDFRNAAAGVAQFNVSHSYLVSVSETFGHTTCADLLGHYVGRKNVKRLQQTRRQNTYKFCRNRKIKSKKGGPKQTKLKNQQALRLNQALDSLIQSYWLYKRSLKNPSDTTEVTNWLKENYLKNKNSQKLKPMKLTSNPIILFYDLETGGFLETADITQIAITNGNSNHSEDMDDFVMPKKNFM